MIKGGDRVSASKMNEELNSLFVSTSTLDYNAGPNGIILDLPDGFEPNANALPKPFEMQILGNSETDSISAVEIKWNQFGDGTSELAAAEDRTFQIADLANVSAIWLVGKKSDISGASTWAISSDQEIADAEGLDKASFYPLYSISATETDVVVLNDYRGYWTSDSSNSGTSGEINLDLSSLNWTDGSDEKAQTWNYEDPQDDDKFDINALSDTLCCRFLARPEDGGTLKYVSLSGILSSMTSEISSHSGCSCDLTAELTSGTKIAAWTKDGVNIVDIYAPAGGGGECSCEMSAIASQYDKEWNGSAQQYWKNAEVGQFTDCQGGKTMLYAPNHIQVSCNMYPYYSNMGNQFTFTNGVSSNIEIVPDGTTLKFSCFYL